MKEKLEPTKLETPLHNIALTFSGGGFRAASYSLGTLSYLDHIKILVDDHDISLLNNVTYLSSTSGGSITNALYTAYIHKGKTFADVYQKMLKELAGQTMLDKVFEVMDDDAAWNKPGNEKSKSFINAFAKVYDTLLYDGEKFGVYWNKNFVPHFEVCFNSTEFYRGLSFRFQTEGTDNAKQVMGNNYLHFDPKEIDTIKKLKIADMVAASSCFPAGFEPIVYPQDFSYADGSNQLSVADLNKAMLMESYQEVVQNITESYGFMDGGITDNQGLYSAMLADKKRRRRVEANPFDVIMVTDVASYFMDEYKVPAQQIEKEYAQQNVNTYIAKIKATLSKVKWSSIIAFILFVAGMVVPFVQTNQLVSLISIFIAGFSFFALVAMFAIKKIKPIGWLLKNNKSIQNESILNNFIKTQTFLSEKMMGNLIHFFRVTKFGILERMLKARMASMLSMLLDVNLKQTRRLIFEMFYESELWENRRIPNFIYELSTYNKVSRTNRFNSEFRLKWKATNEDKELLLNNCEKLNTVAEVARTMGTTLWFDKTDEDKLRQIIAAGQFTTCYNLLEYLISIERKGLVFEDKVTKQLTALKAKLTADFLHFKEDPFFLYDLGK